MSPNHPDSVVHRAYAAYNDRDFEGVAELYAADAELENVATGDTYRGRAGYLQQVRSWAVGFPDSRIEITHLAEDAERATVEYVLRGTHTGALLSVRGHVPPTWTQVEQRFVDVLELSGGRIARVRSYFDAASLLRQMGLLPDSPLHGPDRRAALQLYATQTEAPAQQRNKAVVRHFIASVLNQHHAAAAADVCAPDLAWHGGPLGEIRSLGSYQRFLASFFSSFPDLRVDVEDLISEGERVAARLTLHATHGGEFQGIPATGRAVAGAGTSIFRLAEGRIVEEWWHQDLLSIMKQLDAMPALVRLSAAGER